MKKTMSDPNYDDRIFYRGFNFGILYFIFYAIIGIFINVPLFQTLGVKDTAISIFVLVGILCARKYLERKYSANSRIWKIIHRSKNQATMVEGIRVIVFLPFLWLAISASNRNSILLPLYLSIGGLYAFIILDLFSNRYVEDERLDLINILSKIQSDSSDKTKWLYLVQQYLDKMLKRKQLKLKPEVAQKVLWSLAIWIIEGKSELLDNWIEETSNYLRNAEDENFIDHLSNTSANTSNKIYVNTIFKEFRVIKGRDILLWIYGQLRMILFFLSIPDSIYSILGNI